MSPKKTTSAVFTCLFIALSANLASGQAKIGTVDLAPEQDITLLKRLDKALDEQQGDVIAVVLEDLLRRSRGPLKNLAVPRVNKNLAPDEDDTPTHYRGFRDLVLSRLEQLPSKYRRSIAGGHDAAVRGLLKTQTGEQLSKATMLEIVESYPLSSQAYESAQELAQLAFEEDDLIAAQYYDGFVKRLHRTKRPNWGSYVRRILIAARTGQAKRAKSQLRIFEKKVKKSGQSDLLELAARTRKALERIKSIEKPRREIQTKLTHRVFVYNDKESQRRLFQKAVVVKSPLTRQRQLRSNRSANKAIPASAFVPLVAGNDVLVSNGRRIFIYNSETGKRSAILPYGMDAELPKSPIFGQVIELVMHGNLILSHLLVKQSSVLVSEDRTPPSDSAAPLYGSLMIFDRSRQNRVVFWEGDRGPTRTSTTFAKGSVKTGSQRSVKEVLARGNIVGRPAICGRRIYTALTVHDGSTEVWLAAFDRQPREGGDLGIGLKLTWLTYLSSNAINRGPKTFRLFPAVYLSGNKVFCHNGNATIAAVNALDGTLNWVSHTSLPDPTDRFAGRPVTQRSVKLVDPVREAVRFIKRPGQTDLALFAPPGTGQLFAYDTGDGRLIWATTRSRYKARRFFVTADGIVLRYGYRTLIAIDGRSGKLCSYPVSREDTQNYSFLPERDSVVYSGDYHDGVMALPVGKGWARLIRVLREYDKDGRNPIIEFKVGPRIKLIGTAADGHLRMTPHGFAYATHDQLWIFGSKAPAGFSIDGNSSKAKKEQAKEQDVKAKENEVKQAVKPQKK